MGITRNTLSELINGHASVSTTMALRLGKAFGTTPELWLNMQQNYDFGAVQEKTMLSNVKILFSPEPSCSE